MESSVFPTPVGPQNINDPIGLLGSFSPTLALLTALDIAVTASFCPTTLSWRTSSSLKSLSDSSSVNFSTGILAQTETTFAISVLLTILLNSKVL